MLKLFSILCSIVSFISKLLKPKDTDTSIQKELSDAIKAGNTKKVEQIREYLRRIKS